MAAVFWVMKTSNRIRIRKPAINADHRRAGAGELGRRVRGRRTCGRGRGRRGGALGCSGVPEGLLLMVPSLSHPAQK